MASFEQHVNGAVIATGVVIAPLHTASLIDVSQSLIVLGLGVVGGVLPDLDSDNSKPIQIVFKMVSIFLPLLIILSISENLSLTYLIGYWLISTLILRITLFKLFLVLTSHRGIFHSIPMGIVFGQITTLIFYYQLHYDLRFATIAGIFVVFGFFIHLLLDEFVSLNALGLRMKNSFGSAFKLYDKNNLFGTVILYMLIISFFFLVPIKEHLFIEMFEILKNIKLL